MQQKVCYILKGAAGEGLYTMNTVIPANYILSCPLLQSQQLLTPHGAPACLGAQNWTDLKTL